MIDHNFRLLVARRVKKQFDFFLINYQSVNPSSLWRPLETHLRSAGVSTRKLPSKTIAIEISLKGP